MTAFKSYNSVATKRQDDITHHLLSRRRRTTDVEEIAEGVSYELMYTEEQAGRNISGSSGVWDKFGGTTQFLN
jgi:hypothetical protein